jgi:hypothetical protein
MKTNRNSLLMPTRPSLKSGCARPSAAPEQINFASTIPEAASRQLRFGQSASAKLVSLLGDIVVDALVFEFMGLAMLGLCVVVLAVPSGRQSSSRARPN